MAYQRLIPGGPLVYEDGTDEKLVPGGPLVNMAAGTAAQTLTPSLFTNTQTFYGPTVTPGAVTLTPSLVTNNQTFYAPTLTGSVTLAPPHITNTQTFYYPTINGGRQDETGGWYHRGNFGQTLEDYLEAKRRLREEIAPPEKVEKVIERIAKKVVERAKKVDGPGPIETILNRQQEEAAELKKALKRASLAYDPGYAQLMLTQAMYLVMQQQLLMEQLEEEEAIVSLLMEM